MDIQGILSAEIAKTKKRLESTKALAAAAEGTTNKKYIRRGEVEKLQEQQYRERQLLAEKERREKEEKRRQELASANEQDKNQTSTGDVSNEQNEEDDAPTFNIPAEEVVRRLRAKNQPIRLFAETDKARKLRLRALELMEERSEGQRNDFMETLGQYETRLDLEALKRQAGEDVEDEAAGRRKRKREEAGLEDTTLISIELLQKDPNKVYTLIYVYLKRLLKEWEQELRNQPDEIRRGNQGKLAAAMQKQSTEYIKPFLRQLKKKEVEPDVIARITEIIQFMQNREYVNANDAYLRLSIGNAPWPIGVTMVGIHERSSREKIYASSVAHVLNDEQARKWIQSIKRIMTFCQTKYPPPDNSQLF